MISLASPTLFVVVALWGGTAYPFLPGEIHNYATADALMAGTGLAHGFPVTQSYTSSNTQDNGDGGGEFGLGVQIAGLPSGDNNDFVFVGTGSGTVDFDGTYTFYTNTDDGSRLRTSFNGGALTQIITDNVLSGPHTVASAAIPLASGNTFTFEWMWYERGGGAEGELFYSPNGGTNKFLITDDTGGLTVNGAAYEGKTYKSLIGKVTTYEGNRNDGFTAIENVDDDTIARGWHKEFVNVGIGNPDQNDIPSGVPVKMLEQFTNTSSQAWTGWQEEVLSTALSCGAACLEYPAFLIRNGSVEVSVGTLLSGFNVLFENQDYTLLVEPFNGVSPAGDWRSVSILFKPHITIPPGQALQIRQDIFATSAKGWARNEKAVIAQGPILAVPEPSSFAVAALAGLVMLPIGRRSRNT